MSEFKYFKISREINESSDHLEDSPPPLIGCEDDIQSLVFNETEMEFLRDGMTIEQIIEQRQIAERIQPLSGKSLDSNSRQESPSRE